MYCVPYVSQSILSQSRHERVCAKNQQMSKKRPVFDTSKKRMEGTDLESFLASRPYLKSKKPSTAELVSLAHITYTKYICRHVYSGTSLIYIYTSLRQKRCPDYGIEMSVSGAGVKLCTNGHLRQRPNYLSSCPHFREL